MSVIFGASDGAFLSGYRTVHWTVLPNSLLVSLAEFGGRFKFLIHNNNKN